MHEFGIAQEIARAAIESGRHAGANRIAAVRVKIGVLSGVVDDALRFAFEAVVAGTIAEKARLDIETVGLRCYCPRCAVEFDAEPLAYECPHCGHSAPEIRAGRELDLVSIEVI